jgi:glutamine synthetase
MMRRSIIRKGAFVSEYQNDGTELQRFLQENPGVRFLDAVMFDLVGTPIGKRYPIRDAAKLYASGTQFCAGITTLDALGACWDVNGIGFSDGDPDAVSRPVPGTLVPVPWMEDTAQCLIAAEHPDDPDGWWFDPRAILKRVVKRFEPLGLFPVVACELEFYLIDGKRAPDGSIAPPTPPSGRFNGAPRVLNFAKLDEFGAVLSEIDAAAAAQNVPASVITSEYGGGQYEINLDHRAYPVEAADHALLLKRIVKGVATRHGLDATFMAKPFTAQSGSGLHIHMSLLDRDGNNVFDERRADGEWFLHQAVAGLQQTMHECMGFFVPSLNGYRRFAPNLFVPVNTSWGFNNRSVAFRVPMGGGTARRIEHRTAGADANPYLVMAAVLAGVHHGLANGLTPTEPSEGNAGETADPAMPRHLWTALDRLEASEFVADYFGAPYPAAYAAIKRAELDAFLSEVLPREYDWYL